MPQPIYLPPNPWQQMVPQLVQMYAQGLIQKQFQEPKLDKPTTIPGEKYHWQWTKDGWKKDRGAGSTKNRRSKRTYFYPTGG